MLNTSEIVHKLYVMINSCWMIFKIIRSADFMLTYGLKKRKPNLKFVEIYELRSIILIAIFDIKYITGCSTP